MPGAGGQTHGALAGNGFGLEAGHDRAGFHDVLGEQIGRTHQHTDLHAAFGQRSGHRGDHRTGQRVIDAASEEHVNIRSVGGFHLVQQHANHLLPQREAGDGADMPAAFPAFEYKASGALVEIHLEQGRCRRVDVCGNAFGFEMRSLIRAAAGDQRVGGLAGQNRLDLFFPQFLRNEP